MSFYCYLLESQNKTYIGATVDPNRRLQQHNGEKSGGARATRGRVWKRVLYVSGFPDWTAALQFEWAWKFHSRKQRGALGRIDGLFALLKKGKSTSNALPYIYWDNVLALHISSTNLTHVEKIESSDLHLVEQVATNTQYTFPKTFSFLPFPFLTKMSVSSNDVTQLASLVETLSADMTQMKAQLATLLATANTANTVATVAQPKKPRKAVLKAPSADAPAADAPAADAPTKKPRGRKPKVAEAPATDAAVADAPAAEAPKKARKPYQRKPKADAAPAETAAPTEAPADTADVAAASPAAVKKPRGRKPKAATDAVADAPAADTATTPQATGPATAAPPAPKKVVRKAKATAAPVTPVPTAEVIA